MITSKSMTRVFSDKDSAFDSLFQGIFEKSHLLPKRIANFDERINVLHDFDETDKVGISFQLTLHGLDIVVRQFVQVVIICICALYNDEMTCQAKLAYGCICQCI